MPDVAHKPILIAGPTASGKSGLALRLAQRTGAAIVNADALQVYDCWRILTARPAQAELATAEHLLYGHVPCAADYSAGAWLRDLAKVLKTRRNLIIVGGTGLYLSALTRGLAPIPPTPEAIRHEGNLVRETEGLAPFRRYLESHDPKLYARVDRKNGMRLQRAWEVHRATGRPLSAWQKDTGKPLIPLQNAIALRLDSPVEWLNRRIETRFDQMIAEGALEEAASNLARWDPARAANRALGAAQLVAYLQGALTLGQAREKAIIATRRFAKRQRTWFRSNMGDWTGIDARGAAEPETIQRVMSML